MTAIFLEPKKLSTCILRKQEVLDAIGFKHSTLYNRINDGLFPTPINLCGRAVGWPSNEVQAILDALIKGKSQASIKQLVIELINNR